MDPRHHAGYLRLCEAVLTTPGDTAGALRTAIEARAASLSGRAPDADALDAPLGTYVDKVAQHAYRVVDEDIEALKRAGHSESAIYEITLAASLGAAAARFELATKALDHLE